MRIFVLIFNANTENEGIHSIQIGDRNKILMFESEDDALRFALMLEAQDFPTPTVEEFDSEEIQEFCEGAGYDWEIIPENSDLVLPPEINLDEADWQINAENDDTDDGAAIDYGQVPPAAETEFSDSELDNIRRKLEGLL
jgi:hypothetical protein